MRPHPTFLLLTSPHFPTSPLGEELVEAAEGTSKLLSFTYLTDSRHSLQGTEEELVHVQGTLGSCPLHLPPSCGP